MTEIDTRLVMNCEGVECLYCGVVFEDTEPHPPSIEYINGYPAPCRKIGANVFGSIVNLKAAEIWITSHWAKR